MPILGVIASSRQTAVADTGAMFPLQVVTVGAAGASSVSFTNIPNTYSHLQIRWIARDDFNSQASDANMRFNSDSGSNYSWHQLIGDGSSAQAYASTSQTAARTGIIVGSTGGSNVFGSTVLDILDYANTNKNKTIRNLAGWDGNGTGSIALNSAAWLSTSAITSITITPRVGTNFQQYSQFALYAVKGA
jgi:hypothetical protein